MTHTLPTPFPQMSPPAWADGWGQDRYGYYVSFSIPTGDRYWEVATHRLRWIQPGRFLMGSPENEAGRDEDEGPQHEVTISRGFWLGETACPQSLWEAVMGENPSKFQEADRPVENVSWEDVQTFFARVSDQIPGLDLHLPTEAQ